MICLSERVRCKFLFDLAMIISLSWNRETDITDNYIPVGVNSTNEGVKVNSTVRVKSTGKMWKTKRNFDPPKVEFNFSL